MGVLSFRRRADGGSSAPKPQDWTQQDIADFYRAANLLQQNGVGIGMDRGLSDRGEPWLAFYDTATQDVFIHVARIQGRCLLVSETLDLNLRAATIAELIGHFEDAVQTLVSRRSVRDRNVVLHPAARVIMAITATFLLFKLENSGAAHAGEADGGDTPEGVARKSEMSASARVHQAIARLLETVDSPTAIAAVASLLIAAEISKLDLPSQAGETVVIDGVPQQELEALRAALAEAGRLQAETDDDATTWLADGEAELAKAEVVAAADAEGAIHVAIDYEAILERAAEIVQLSQAEAPATAEGLPIGDGSVLSLLMLAQAASGSSTLDVGQKAASSDAQPVTGLVLAGLKSAIGADLFARLVEGASHFGDGPTVAAAGGSLAWLSDALHGRGAITIDEISLSALDDLGATVGHFVEAQTGAIAIAGALDYFWGATKSTGYAVEEAGDAALFEQSGLEGMDAAEIGVWKGETANGAIVTIVGQVDLIDQIESLLS